MNFFFLRRLYDVLLGRPNDVFLSRLKQNVFAMGFRRSYKTKKRRLNTAGVCNFNQFHWWKSKEWIRIWADYLHSCDILPNIIIPKPLHKQTKNFMKRKYKRSFCCSSQESFSESSLALNSKVYTTWQHYSLGQFNQPIVDLLCLFLGKSDCEHLHLLLIWCLDNWSTLPPRCRYRCDDVTIIYSWIK